MFILRTITTPEILGREDGPYSRQSYADFCLAVQPSSVAQPRNWHSASATTAGQLAFAVIAPHLQTVYSCVFHIVSAVLLG
jgi:hypothetical protein